MAEEEITSFCASTTHVKSTQKSGIQEEIVILRRIYRSCSHPIVEGMLKSELLGCFVVRNQQNLGKETKMNSINHKTPMKTYVHPYLLRVLFVLPLLSTLCLGVTFTKDTRIGPDDTTYDNEHILVDGCVLTVGQDNEG